MSFSSFKEHNDDVDEKEKCDLSKFQGFLLNLLFTWFGLDLPLVNVPVEKQLCLS